MGVHPGPYTTGGGGGGRGEGGGCKGVVDPLRFTD